MTGAASYGSLAVAFAMAMVAAIPTVYWHARSKSPLAPPTRLSLLMLRLAVIALVAITWAFDPAIVRKATESTPGTVVIAVDRSASMRLTDPHRPTADKFALAEQWNLTNVPSATLQLWRSIAATGGTPKFAGPNDPDRAAYDRTLATIDGLTRFEAARKTLAHRDWLSRLRAIHRVELVDFDSQLHPDSDRPPDSDALTDLQLPLNRARELGPNLVGVVLLSDGRPTIGDRPDARSIVPNAPVHVVSTMPRNNPIDLAIAAAKPRSPTALKGAVVPIDVTLSVRNWPPDLLRVTIDPPAGKPVSATVGHSGGDATLTLTLPVKIDASGIVSLPVRVEGAEPDRIPENDRRTTTVTVVRDKARVLLIDAEPRWEFHYLHIALGRDPHVELRSVVLRQPRLGTDRDSQLRSAGFPATKCPDADTLTAYDLVILGDLDPADLPGDWTARLEKFVADQGGALAVIPGKAAMPMAWPAGAIRRLIPIRDPQVIVRDNGESLEPTVDSERVGFLQFAETPGANREIWDRLPPHHWLVAGSPKPAATVLLTAGEEAKWPVMLMQPYGFGRVLWLGIDSTWRWRLKAGDRYHHRFWGQVAQWAASDRLLPAVNAAGTIRFGPREPVTESGQESRVVVRWSDEAGSPGATKAVRVTSADAPERIVSMSPLTGSDERPRELTATIPSLPPGRYAIELVVPEWANALRENDGPLQAALTVTTPESIEWTDPTPDWNWLDRTAQTTGGEVHTLDTLDRLVDSLAARSATREITIERRLRHSWWLFGTIIGLLTVDWIVRKYCCGP